MTLTRNEATKPLSHELLKIRLSQPKERGLALREFADRLKAVPLKGLAR